MEDINEVDYQNDNIFYVYFIESHHFSNKTKVYLSSNYPGAESLESLDKSEFKKDSSTYINSLYRFKIYPISQEDDSIKINIEYNNKENLEYEISFLSSKRNIFLFDFNSNFNIFESKINFNEEFLIYIKYLKEKMKKNKDSEEFKDLFDSLFSHLSNIFDEKMDFSFYLSLLLESFNTKYFVKVLELFNSEKIKDSGEIQQNEIDEFKKILNNFEKKANFKEIEEEYKDLIIINLYSTIYFFCIKYNQEYLKNLFENNYIRQFLLKGLIKHRLFFSKITLPKNLIVDLIKIAVDPNELNISLSYNSDFIVFLEIINENIELFAQNIDGQDISLINTERIILPKKEDDINKIYFEIHSLLSYEKKFNKKIIKISSNIFDNYIMFYDSRDLDRLNILNNIIKEICQVDPNFVVRNDPEFLIHENYIYFASQHKLSNMEILDFIKKDKYYNDDKYSALKYRSTKIISGIDIRFIEPDFISKWREINFKNIFNNNYYEFKLEVCKLINNISDFWILFELLNESGKDKIGKHFGLQSLMLLQTTFEKLLNTYDPQKCPTFINDAVDLIFYTDQQKFNVINFLKDNIQKNLDENLVDLIYFQLLSKYHSLTEPVVDLVINYFIQNKPKLNASSLIELIKISPIIKNKIMKKLDKFVIKEDEFFEIEETNNYKILSGLLKTENFFPKNNENIEGIEYFNKSMIVLMSETKNVKNLEINYNIINYFVENKKEDILLDRLKTIFLLDEKVSKQQYNLLLKNSKLIKDAINKLQSALDKIIIFFPNKYYKEIISLNMVIKEIKICTLKTYINIYSLEYNNYINKFNEDLEKIGNKYKSNFFITIYNDIRNSSKSDDDNCFSIAIQQFGKMKEIFSKNKLSDIKYIDLCLRPFKDKEEQLKNEIDIDIELLNIKKVKNIEELYKEFLLLLRRNEVIQVIESLKYFINTMKAIKDEFSKEIDNILKKLQKINTNEVHKAIQFLLKNNIKIYKEKNDKEINKDYLDIILLLNNNEDAIDFLLNTSIEDCETLQELPGLFENGFLSTEDIIDLEKCINFAKNAINIKEFKNKKDIEVINIFKTEIPKYEKISLYFTKYINNFPILKDIMKNDLDKAQTSKNKVLLLFEKSEFTLTNNKEKFFNCLYFEKSRNNKNDLIPSKLNLKDLFDLRDRAQLNRIMIEKNGENSKEKEKIISNNKRFIELVSEINNLYGILKEIYWKGYIKEVIIKINIENNIIMYNYESKNYNKFEDIIILIKDILNKIKEQEISGYKEKKFVRYFFGLHFNKFYKIANEKKKQAYKLNQLMPFLQYVTNELIERNLESFNYKTSQNEYKDIIINCERFIKKVLKLNKLSYDQIYNGTLNERKEKISRYRGIYIYSSENLEKDIFQIYKYFTFNNPVAQNILLCNKDSTKEEITSFLYRAILCEFNSCFIIGGIESLNFEKRTIFIDLINNIYIEKYKDMNSSLFILYTNKSSDIYKWLDLEKTIKKLDINRKDYQNEKYTEGKIEVIYSDKSGVGKSTNIKNEILNKNKKYIYFPLGGVLKREDILNRLEKLELDNDSIIHLDLFDTSQTSLMMEFLFSALITKLYGKNERLFYLSKEIEIKIEIPNSFIDFFAKFPILNLFPKKMLSINNLAPLIVSYELSSNIQIVCNYLKGLQDKNIDEKDLIFPNITPDGIKNNIGEIIEKKGNKKDKLIKHKFTTIADALVLYQDICQNLIFKAIKQKIEKPTYYQINSFIEVLAVQLIRFNQNYHLSACQLKERYQKVKKNIRTSIVESFINLTKYIIEGSFSGLLEKQEITHKNLAEKNEHYEELEDIKNAINDLANKINLEVISFDSIKDSLLFFHEGVGQSFSIITNKDKNDEEYINLLNIKNSQVIYKKDLLKELPDYKNYSQKQFLEEIKDILNISNPVEKDPKSKKISLKEICHNYIFTADNFLKMVLILLRIKSNIPVIMMGETGCGKTSLIRKLSELKNNGNSDKMKVLNIHAGTSDNDIVNFIEEKVMPESVSLKLKELERKKEYEKMGLIFEEAKIWVFLDEINTCKSMGLISEIICKHSYNGNAIPSNVSFIAACNPYRQRDDRKIENIGLDFVNAHQQKQYLNEKELEDIKFTKNVNLVYSVNPLPHSLLNFVFYFGDIDIKDIKKYMERMIKQSLKKKFNENRGNLKKSDLKKLIEFAEEMLFICHIFIRNHNDYSAVSLREIRRFIIFYEFFYDFIKYGKKHENSYQNCNGLFSFLAEKEFDIHFSAVNLSIFICYYMRISNKNLRESLYDQLNTTIFSILNEQRDFLEIPLRVENFIIDNIKIERGIAKNKALLENIFALSVAIINKVPIFIVGKPGCSKSLSVQLITKSMRGNLSNNALFKDLPKVIVNSYQGSKGSTSEGVENVFAKARKIIQDINEKEREKNISMIFFDEMGLAEHSPNNPLKVIHSELEYDLNEGDKKVAFVGISNWTLDASKMNRGIYISIPEPDEEDIIETSLTIGKSYNEIIADKFKQFFINLGKIYFEYKNYLKKYHSLDGKEDFHGNRDFYYLIKNASINLSNKYNNYKEIDDNILYQIYIDSIERNFSGIEFKINDFEKITSLQVIKNIFKAHIFPNYLVLKEYDVVQRIRENIFDLNSRYLLVIADPSISSCLLTSILINTNKNYSFFIGSEFEEDHKSEEYSLNVLNKVQLLMEQGNILILNNLESVYPNLYDLFNQNFTVLGNKNYARLAVGSTTNTFSFVNNNFRCIVIVDSDKIDNEEPPFLNRFEKHILSYEYLLNKELADEAKRIYKIMKSMVNINSNTYKGINYDFSKLLINCNMEEIQGLVYELSKKNIPIDKIIDEILRVFALVLPQDILFSFKQTEFQIKYPIYAKKIIEYYNEGEHINLANFIATLNNTKNVVYTFSNNMESIKNFNIVENPEFGTFERENIAQIEINSIKSENELERQLDIFYSEENYKLCIINLKPNEGKFMNYLKNFIENKEKYLELNKKSNNNNICKIFIFIVHMARIFKSELENLNKKTKKEQNEINKKILNQTLSNLAGYYQIFIDNLNGNEQISLDKILKMRKDELFFNCLNLDRELLTNIFTSLTYINYNIISSIGALNEKTYIKKFMHFIRYNPDLRELINKCILRQAIEEDDLISNVFKQKDIVTHNDVDLVSIIIKYLSDSYIHQLNLFVFKAEKDHLFSSLLSNKEEKMILEREKNKNKKRNKQIIKEEDIDDDYVEEIKNIKNDSKKVKTKDGEVTTLDMFEITKQIYLENVIFNNGNIQITEGPGANNLEIILGLKLPGLKTTIDTIIQKVKEGVKLKYFKNEEDLRRNINKGEQLEKDINNYKQELKRLDDFTNLEIENIEIVKLIEKRYKNNQEDANKFYELMLNDYYTLYINYNFNKTNDDFIEINNDENNIINDNDDYKSNKNKKYSLEEIEEIKRMLKLLVELKIKYYPISEALYMKQIGCIINWLEVYVVEIISILKMYMTLKSIVINLYEQIRNIIDKNQVNFEISERNPEHMAFVNKGFFIALESLLRVVTSNVKIYNNLKNEQDKFFKLINIDKQLNQDGMQLNTSLCLYSKEIFSLQEIVIIFETLYRCKINTVENLTKTITFFSKQTNLIIKKKESDLISNLKKLCEFLLTNTKNNSKYGQMIAYVLWNEFNKIIFEDYRIKIIEIILDNNELIRYSTQIMTFIINNILDHSIEGIGNNLDIIHDSKSNYLKILNNSKKIFLDEILINIFETKINIYFDSIPYASDEILENYYPKVYFDKINKINSNNVGIILDQSFKAFQKYLGYLELAALDKKKKNNSHIIKLYALTYVKIYLSKLLNYLKVRKNNLLDASEIMKIIKGKNNNNFRKVIKIYIFKLIYNDLNNFEEFQNFNFKDYNIDFAEEFNFKNQNQSMLNYYFLPLDNDEIYEKYLEQFNKFEKCRKKKFIFKKTGKFANYIKTHGIDIFLDVSINKIISNLGFKNFNSNPEYHSFSLFCKKLFSEKYNFKNGIMNNLLSLFFDENTYKNKLMPLFKKGNYVNQKLLEIVLYGFRYCVSSLSAKENPSNNSKCLLYETFLSNICMKYLKGSYIPGSDLIDDLHIRTFDIIKEHLDILDDRHGCYVCSCGYYYEIEPCGFPARGNTSKCPNCGLNIGWAEKVVNKGWGDHGIAIRPGHYRIYKDDKQRNFCQNKYGVSSQNIPSKTLDEYKKDIIDPILNKGNLGLNIVSKEFFLRTDKKIRKISEFTFRLLHFINYSHLFFSNILEFVNVYTLKYSCLVKDMTCLEIIEKDWDIMKEILQNNEIYSIQIFMNLIFSRVSNLIKNCVYCNEEKMRNSVEEQVEFIIYKGLKEYKSYSQKYEVENAKQLNINSSDMKTIICELMPPNEKIYKKKDYPLLKYFMFTKYKTLEDFINKLGPANMYMRRFPLIGQYLLDKPGPKKMKYLPEFNEFTNYMLYNYSFKISRDNAKKRILENEEIFNEPSFKNKFNNFINVWDKIKIDATKYKFRPEMPIKNLSQKDTLNNFLNDEVELYGGMYIASAFQNFIFWQNSFLQPIINAVKHNGILHYYVNNLKRKIPIQSARINQTLLIDDCFINSEYKNFIELIYTFSKRNIFTNEGTINYINYNIFTYDYYKIEEELGKLLLPGKCMFESEYSLNFVTYWSEGFKRGKSDTLKIFYEKYPQKDLNKDEKKIIMNYINVIILENNYYDFKGFFGSLQLLIFYLINNDVKKDEKISNIINSASPYLKITNDCLNFFNHEGNQFTLDYLMNIFFFIEYLCFNDLIESLQPEYKMEISGEVSKKIREELILDKNPFKKYIGYSLSNLAAAVRRFISRYLVGNRQVIDIDEKMDLVFNLSRADLWAEKIGKLNNLEDLLSNQLNEFGLKVGQAFAFYQIIAEEDKIDSFNNDRNNINNINIENKYDKINLDILDANEENKNNNFINEPNINNFNDNNFNNNINNENNLDFNNNLDYPNININNIDDSNINKNMNDYPILNNIDNDSNINKNNYNIINENNIYNNNNLDITNNLNFNNALNNNNIINDDNDDDIKVIYEKNKINENINLESENKEGKNEYPEF